MSETSAPGPKKFARTDRSPAPSHLDLSDIRATPSARPGAPMSLPDDYQAAPGPRRRRARETKSKTLTMRIKPSTFARFDDFCDREQLSQSDAFDRLLDLATRPKD